MLEKFKQYFHQQEHTINTIQNINKSMGMEDCFGKIASLPSIFEAYNEKGL